MWEDYIGQGLPAPTEIDRARLERAGGGALPDSYWALVQAHQGQIRRGHEIEVSGQGAVNFGVLLLAIPPARAGDEQSYSIETCLHNMADYYPTGLLPFADDTGGNYWAFDLRRRSAPCIVFIDHELEGEEGLTPIADSFEAFMAL